MGIMEWITIIFTIICITLVALCYIYRDYIENEMIKEDKPKKRGRK